MLQNEWLWISHANTQFMSDGERLEVMVVQLRLQKLVLAGGGAPRQVGSANPYATDKFELQKVVELGIWAARYWFE